MKSPSKLTDEELVEYIRRKDREAYGAIITRYQAKLLRYANSLVRHEAEAADVVQNAFIKAFINLNGFNIKKKFSSWIYRIVHNEAINSLAKHQREGPLLEDVNLNSDENAQDDWSKRETQKRVEKCLSVLPLIYAEPLSLFFLEEKSYEEISDILRLPIGTVGTRINRAKILMKKICQKIK